MRESQTGRSANAMRNHQLIVIVIAVIAAIAGIAQSGALFDRAAAASGGAQADAQPASASVAGKTDQPREQAATTARASVVKTYTN